MSNEKLSDEDILMYIADFIDQNGYPPTVRELCEETGLSSTATIQYHLKKLKEKGYITYKEGSSRTIKIL